MHVSTAENRRSPGGILPHERPVVVRAAAIQFLLLTALYSLRPLRDALGISGGSEQLPWLFTATFVGMSILSPLFAAAASRLGRRALAAVVYHGCAFVLVILYAGLTWGPRLQSAWAFFVWISIFNMFAMSMFWSVMADRTPVDGARRLFGPITAGASLGAIFGPSIAGAVARWLDPDLLLLIAACLLEAVFLVGQPLWQATATDPAESSRPLGGRFYDGLIELLRTPVLRALGVYLVMMTAMSTVVYFEQGRILERTITGDSDRTVFLAGIDLAVNLLALAGQAWLAPRIMTRWGLSPALAVLPLVCVAGFSALGVWPGLVTLAAFQVIRRASDYGLAKPAREALFTTVERSARYKAKNFIDTVVYRGGDAATGWAFTALLALGLGASAIAFAMTPLAFAWSVLGYRLGAVDSSRPPAKMQSEPRTSA